MRSLLLAICAVFVLAFSVSLRGGEKPRRAQDQDFSLKVWTNNDIDELRERGLISIVGPEPVTQAVAPAAVAAAPLTPVAVTPVREIYNSRLDDPEWYAEQAAFIQAELARREALLEEELTAIALAQRGITQPGIALDKPSYGVTPQDAVANLQAGVAEIQDLLDELNDAARVHNIPVGVLQAPESQSLVFEEVSRVASPRFNQFVEQIPLCVADVPRERDEESVRHFARNDTVWEDAARECVTEFIS